MFRQLVNLLVGRLNLLRLVYLLELYLWDELALMYWTLLLSVEVLYRGCSGRRRFWSSGSGSLFSPKEIFILQVICNCIFFFLYLYCMAQLHFIYLKIQFFFQISVIDLLIVREKSFF